MNNNRVCPRCKMNYDGYPAISRVDNKTEICQDCGTAEALEAYWSECAKKHEEERWVRCTKCSHKLFRPISSCTGNIEIKCSSCKNIMTVKL